MTYEVKASKQVRKFLLSCQKNIADKFYQKAKILAQDPYGKNLDVRILQGQKENRRLRIGKYRFLYTMHKDQILIYFYEADSRGDIY